MEAALEGKLPGKSLAEIMAQVGPELHKGKRLANATDAAPRHVPIRMAKGGGRRAASPAAEAKAAATPDAGDRWGKVTRSGAHPAPEEGGRRRRRSAAHTEEEVVDATKSSYPSVLKTHQGEPEVGAGLKRTRRLHRRSGRTSRFSDHDVDAPLKMAAKAPGRSSAKKKKLRGNRRGPGSRTCREEPSQASQKRCCR